MLLEEKNDGEIINTYKESVLKKLSSEEIDKIHDEGYITAQEKVMEWESFGLCAPSNSLGKGSNRCREFTNCHECLIDFASQKDKWISMYKIMNNLNEQPMFNISNAIKPKILTKKKD